MISSSVYPSSSESMIIVVGSSNQDLTCYTNSIPTLGQTVIGQKFHVSPGGKGANQAIAASKLLISPNTPPNIPSPSGMGIGKTVHFITQLGNDSFANLLLQHFQQAHVHVHVHTQQHDEDESISTGVAQIIVDQTTGDNMIIVIPGANNLLTPDIVDIQMSSILNQQYMYQDKNNSCYNNLGNHKNNHHKRKIIVLSQLEIPIESTFQAMKIGHQSGATTILNPAPCNIDILQYKYHHNLTCKNDDTATTTDTHHNATHGSNNSSTCTMLHYVDILIPNETELQQLANAIIHQSNDKNHNNNDMTEEEMAKLLLYQGGIRQAVIVTLGARGALIVSRRNIANNSDINTTFQDDHDHNNSDSNHHDNYNNMILYETIMVNAPPELDCHHLPVVDTVGAGDSFCGSFSVYLSCGFNLKDAATKACGVASMSVRKQGAQSSYPSANDLPSILKF